MEGDHCRGSWKQDRWVPPGARAPRQVPRNPVRILLSRHGHVHEQVQFRKNYLQGEAENFAQFCSLRESTEGEPDVATIESALDGNICRCTGYRPILDAFKSFAEDAPADLKAQVGTKSRILKRHSNLASSLQVSDIEDLARNGGCNGANEVNGICQRTNAPCTWREQQTCPTTKKISGHTWYQPRSLEELRSVIKGIEADRKFRLVAGNTGTGSKT